MRCTKLKRVAIFCGASAGNNSEYSTIAQQLASALHKANISLIYGGAKIGIMGKLADAALSYGVEVIGVMPKAIIEREVAHSGIAKLHIVDSMHERKALMTELADGFILLPGGIGSLDEFFESWTWLQLGYHAKPCGILNTANYFNSLISFLDHATSEGFISTNCRNTIFIENDPHLLLEKFINYQAPLNR